MKRNLGVIVIMVLGIGFSSTTALAEIKIGTNYPGIQLGWLDSGGRYALEIRGEYDFGGGKIWALGPRMSYYFLPLSLFKRKVALFCALEGDYISFKGQVSKGTGYCFQAMGGVEQPIVGQRVSLEATFGGVYLSLTDSKTGLSESSVEGPIFQIGLNFYF